MSTYYGAKIVTDNLALCLDAANAKSYPGSGNTWYDVSGNNRNYTWYAAPSFTSGGSLSYFSTLNNRCTGPASNSFGIDNTSGYTIIMYALQNGLANTAAFKFYGDVGYNRGIFAHCTWGDDRIYFDQGGCCGSDTRTDVNSGGTSTWNMFGFRRVTGASDRSIWKNGNIIASNSNTAATIGLNATAADLGSTDEYGGNASTWNARLAMFLVYNRGLTDFEILQIYNATKGRFGL